MEENDMKHHEHQEHDEGEQHSQHEEHAHDDMEQKPHAEGSAEDEAGHDTHGGEHGGHEGDHEGHVDHTGHEEMFRRRFWISLVLSIPVLVFSPTLQDWLGYTIPDFPGSEWITPVLAVIVFLYGGIPFLQMAVKAV